MAKFSMEIWLESEIGPVQEGWRLDVEPKPRFVVDVVDSDHLPQPSKPTSCVRLTAPNAGGLSECRKTGKVSVYVTPTTVVVLASTIEEVVDAYRRLLAGESPEQVYVPTDHRQPMFRTPSALLALPDGDGIDSVPRNDWMGDSADISYDYNHPVS